MSEEQIEALAILDFVERVLRVLAIKNAVARCIGAFLPDRGMVMNVQKRSMIIPRMTVIAVLFRIDADGLTTVDNEFIIITNSLIFILPSFSFGV